MPLLSRSPRRWCLCFALATWSFVLLSGGANVSAEEPAGKRHGELREMLQFLQAATEQGPAMRPLLPEGTILSISRHLSPELVSMVVDKLSDPATLERLGLDRPTVNQLIMGLSLVTPLLEDIEPQVQIIFARPKFDGVEAVPEPKFPAVALIFRPRDMRQAKSVLLSAYLAAMNQANQTAKAQGRPQLKLESKRRGDGFYATSVFRLPEDAEPEIIGLADYNLSPSIAVVGQRMILCSSRGLTLDLVDLATAEAENELDPLVSETVRLDIGPAAGLQLLADNFPAIAGTLAVREAFRERVVNSARRAERISHRALSRLPRDTIVLRFKLPLRKRAAQAL